MGLALLTAILIWLAVFDKADDKLHIIACDVGQGDAILTTLGSIQILVDGGPNNKVLDCLSGHMPFWDREIEVVLLTHPQKDHFGGLIDVFKSYKVENFVSSALDSGSREYKVLKNLVGGSGAKIINPTYGSEIRLGVIRLDILWPSEDFLVANIISGNAEQISSAGENYDGVLGAFTSKRDPNEFSLVAVLRFGNFDALLTGDIGPEVSGEISQMLEVNSQKSIEYLKVPHHGSKNGLTGELLEASRPEIAVISVGKNNSYGHPHEEVMSMLTQEKIRVLRTDQMGNVVILTDGRSWEVK